MKFNFTDKFTLESLVSFINGSADNSVRDEANLWINSSADNRKFYERFREVWQHADDLPELLKENRDKDWERIWQECQSTAKSNLPDNKRKLSVWWWRAAAAVLLLIFTTVAYYAGNKRVRIPVINNTALYHEIVVPNGDKSELKLSDGTVMWINAGSKVRFPLAFENSTRDVWLDGEAYFEVAKDKNRPFIVHTSDVNVKVHGTRFNLKAYDTEDVFEATLLEGSVSLETRDILNNVKEEVILEPNYKAIYLKKKPQKIENGIIRSVSQPLKPRKLIISDPVNNVESAISWREGKLEFSDETLENIAIKLERRYGVSIEMRNEEIEDIRYSGVLKNISIEQALKAIQMTADFEYEIDDNKVIISTIKK